MKAVENAGIIFQEASKAVRDEGFERALIWYSLRLNLKERDLYMIEFIEDDILDTFSIKNPNQIDQDTVVRIFEHYTRSKHFGKEKMAKLF
jgi:hypothetical protein